MNEVIIQSPISRKPPISHTCQSPICNTCKSPIDDLTYRFLIVKNRYMKHELLSFHYFFPCWDVNYVFQNLMDYEIIKAGFSCDASIKKNPKTLRNLRRNDDLWDLNKEMVNYERVI
jgi:hypothetical protein